MGTNYYHRTSICSCCGRYDETHICKSHISFEAITEWQDDGNLIVTVGTWTQWRERLLADGEVWNQYGEHIPTTTFIADVESVTLENRRRQYDWCVEHQHAGWRDIPISDDPHPDAEWLDPLGYSFSGRPFS